MKLASWTPAATLAVGVVLTLGLRGDRRIPLIAPLTQAVPRTLAGMTGTDVVVSDQELAVAAPTTYVLRAFGDSTGARDSATAPSFTVYVAYYDRQTQGKTIHSPKNCLPGAGWEPLTSSVSTVSTPAGPVPVNRYLLQHDKEKALVLYWYQGRGRVAANEYLVKWQLLRDSALRHRSDEALVRIIVPLKGDDEAGAYRTAAGVVTQLVPALYQVLPS